MKDLSDSQTMKYYQSKERYQVNGFIINENYYYSDNRLMILLLIFAQKDDLPRKHFSNHRTIKLYPLIERFSFLDARLIVLSLFF